MDNLPLHMRITGLTPSNEDVDARRSAVSELASAWRKITDVNQILGKAAMIATSLSGDGRPVEDLGMEVQHAVQTHASAFLYEESPLDVGICAGMAALSILGTAPGIDGWTVPDIYSNALCSALAFQPVLPDEKREKLRREVFDVAHQRSRESADKARERSVVPDLLDLTVTIAAESKVTTNFKKATVNTIEALRRNAALDREELDFLWWVQLNRSRLLNRPMAALPEAARLVASGIEAAGHLRRLPASVHYDLVLRTLDQDPELDLAELMDVIGDHRETLAASYGSGIIAQFPTVFPLLHAIATGNAVGAGAKMRRKVSTWGGRALLEAGIHRMHVNGAMKL